MKRSIMSASPVISLVSSSSVASRRLQKFLEHVLNMKPLANGSSSSMFDSVASACPTSGTVFHLVSFSTNKTEEIGEPCILSLLGITEHKESSKPIESVRHAMTILERHREHHGSKRWKSSLIKAFGGALTSSHILGKEMSRGGLPFLQLDGNNDSQLKQDVSNNRKPAGGIREITLPYYDDSNYDDGSTLLSMLSSNTTLGRPVVGLYKNHNLAIRPLPAAQQDRSLPLPSLVFGCSDTEMVRKRLVQHGAHCAKIGYNGAGKNGQLIIKNDALWRGLDIRICDESLPYSSCFAEAQDALLASSLKELQSADVMMDGTEENIDPPETLMDSMIGAGDCWVEFRANMKKPSGFLKRKLPSARVRVAKPPDLPYQ